MTSALGGPLGNDPSGFRIVRVQEDSITHEYVPVEDLIAARKTYADADAGVELAQNASPDLVNEE